MNFVETLTNTAYTENGALSNKSSLNANLDLFSMYISSDPENRERLLKDALNEDFKLATKVIWYLRDCRGGQGNKDALRAYSKFMTTFSDIAVDVVKKLLPDMPKIGYWKNVYELYGISQKLDQEILKVVGVALENGDGLCAKYFPRQSKFHKDFAEFTKYSVGSTRRYVANLTKVVETQMCNKEWNQIEYQKVPSVANKKYVKAFNRNDGERYQEFIDSVLKGDTKINSSQLYPHEISHIAKVGSPQEVQQADALWLNLPNYMETSSNILPVIDVSGSMLATAYSNYSCMDIAVGLGLYFSEHNTGTFKDLWCNFSSLPKFMKLKGDTLSKRIQNLDYKNWSMTTDIQKVFEAILVATIKSPEDCPKAILIVSDMEFDEASPKNTNFEEAKIKYQEAGLELPTVIFWRVNVTQKQQPVTQHESGTILVNGYSPAIMKLICAMDIDELMSITPLKFMMQTLEKYSYLDDLLV